jgi:hypothetical protein
MARLAWMIKALIRSLREHGVSSKDGPSRRELLKFFGIKPGTLSVIQLLSGLSLTRADSNGQATAKGLAGRGRINIVETSRDTYQLHWDGGELELNLVPMNDRAVGGNEYKVSTTKGRLVDGMADAVGIIGFRLGEHPRVRRKLKRYLFLGLLNQGVLP